MGDWDQVEVVGNPWLSIWTRPRATVRYLVATHPTRNVTLLAALGGISSALGNATQRNLGDRLPLGAILLIALIGGPIGGLISLHVGASLLSRAGRWIGGVADAARVRTAMAWSYVPQVVAGLLYVPLILLLGNGLFQSTPAGVDESPPLVAMIVGIFVAQFVLAIWSFILFLKTVGEVHRFSAWKTLLACVLLGLAIVVPIVVIVLLILAFAR